MNPGAYAGERLNLGNMWEGPPGKCLCCQPDSGKPTVRDERGACGNVSYGGIRNPRCESKEHRSETLRLRLRASYFYPTVAADKATSQQVQVLPCQLPEVRHVAIPQLLRVISASLRGVNGPAAPWDRPTAVGAIWGSSEHGSRNMKE